MVFGGAQGVRFRTPGDLSGCFCCEYAGDLFEVVTGGTEPIRHNARTILCVRPRCWSGGLRRTGKSRGMQSPGELNPIQETAPLPARPPETTEQIYDLRAGKSASDGFYAEVAGFSVEILAGIERRAASLLDGYSRHVQELIKEKPRSRGDYSIELLMLGMALRRYEGAAQQTPGWVVDLARQLYEARSKSADLKPQVDRLRAEIAKFFLAPAIGRRPKTGGNAVERVAGLVEWLSATGEFEQESKRLDNWRDYLATLTPSKATYWLQVAREMFDSFERKAAKRLGCYTRGVQPFLEKEYAQRGSREDTLFCGRSVTEYHLNMVAAEVMNRGLREDFDRTTRRILLVPACMRGAKVNSCRAHVDGVDMTCSGCDPDCAVNRITRRMKAEDVQVYIVPHSSGFSRWLDRWQREPEVGVMAVACMLNIVPGGFEMRARGIASQCVPLDYPGCKKHWDGVGIPTAVNEDRLVQILVAQR